MVSECAQRSNGPNVYVCLHTKSKAQRWAERFRWYRAIVDNVYADKVNASEC